MEFCTQNPAALPPEIKAGTTFRAKLALGDYPATAWRLTLNLRGAQAIDLAAEADADGTSFLLAADAAVTAKWAPGRYWFSLRVTDGVAVHEAGAGQLMVLADLSAAAGAYDGRSEAETALDAIDAVLAKRATRDQERYRINNRELYRMAVADLLKLRAYYATRVRRERAAASGRRGFGRAIAVRFGL
jgi:hypothetical protein